MRPYLFHIPVSKPSTVPVYRLSTLIMGVSLFFTHLGHRKGIKRTLSNPADILCIRWRYGGLSTSCRDYTARVQCDGFHIVSRNKDTGSL